MDVYIRRCNGHNDKKSARDIHLRVREKKSVVIFFLYKLSVAIPERPCGRVSESG